MDATIVFALWWNNKDVIVCSCKTNQCWMADLDNQVKVVFDGVPTLLTHPACNAQMKIIQIRG